MFFTREDINKIYQALLKFGIKDSELTEIDTIDDTDTLSLVHNNENKKISIKNFLEEIALRKTEDFINITDLYNKSNLALIEAIQLIPSTKRKSGLVITFKDYNNNWQLYQFVGSIEQFTKESSWKDLYWFLTKASLSYTMDITYVEDYYIDNVGNAISKTGSGYYKFNYEGLKSFNLKGMAMGRENCTYAFYRNTTISADNMIESKTYTGVLDIVVPVPRNTKLITVSNWINKRESLVITNPTFYSDTSIFNVYDREFIDGFYINNNGAPIADSNAGYYKFKNYNFSTITLVGIIGGTTDSKSYAFYSNSEVSKKSYIGGGKLGIGGVRTTIKVPPFTETIVITNAKSPTREDINVINATYNVNTERLYSCVNKPFNFSGKKALFFGDDTAMLITSEGEYTVHPSCWVDIFAKRVGLTYENKSEKEAQITVNTSAPAPSILTTISNIQASTEIDVIFIIGGYYDYNNYVPIGDDNSGVLTEFCGSLNLMCRLLNKKFPNAEVIFITPINTTKERDISIAEGKKYFSLNEYRDAIFRIAVSNGYSIVNGEGFGFPSQNGIFKDIMIPDGIHLSEKGHKFYAKSLAGIIL